MKRRMRSSGYYRRERHNWLMIAIVWAAIIGICYYVYIGNKCVKHYQGLVQGHAATIALFGGE